MVIARKPPARPSADAVLRRISLRELRLLLIVERCGNMLKAAHEAGLTQPAISKAIGELEATLGVRLFDRGNRGVEPTPQGQVLIRRAHAVFEEMRQGVHELDALENASGGHVRVGATPALCAGLLGQALSRMQATHPQVMQEVMELESGQLMAEVRARQLDFAVGRQPALRLDDEVEVEPLFEDRLFVIAGARHALAKQRRIRPADLAAQRWVLPQEGSYVHGQIRAAFERFGQPMPAAAVSTMSTLLRYELLATQRFITAVHGSLLRHGRMAAQLPGGLHVLPVDLEATLPIALFRARNRSLAPAAGILMRHLRELGEEMKGFDGRMKSTRAK
jgi:DNA-binding transcriptional LysR family regulator